MKNFQLSANSFFWKCLKLWFRSKSWIRWLNFLWLPFWGHLAAIVTPPLHFLTITETRHTLWYTRTYNDSSQEVNKACSRSKFSNDFKRDKLVIPASVLSWDTKRLPALYASLEVSLNIILFCRKHNYFFIFIQMKQLIVKI